MVEDPFTLIVGVGNPMRGDDGVGPAVVDRLAPHLGPDVRCAVVDADPLPLMDLWAGADRVIVVDAVRSGRPPGTVHHLVDPTRLPRGVRSASSHLVGLGELLGLADALGTLPHRLEFFGVEVARLDLGSGLGDEVAAAVDEVCDGILESLADA